MEKIDFNGLSAFLLQRVSELLPVWLPGGKINGHEYCCSDLNGGNGDSCKVNIRTGKWADFSSTEKGGDLVSLYAAIEEITQVEAARTLSNDHNYKPVIVNKPATVSQPISRETILSKPPVGQPAPIMNMAAGKLAASWVYRDKNGDPLFYVARYDTEKGKEFFPWSWNGEKWICKGWPEPRPLYGLDKLAQEPLKPVLVVEGEKAADAAHQLLGMHYVVATWPNGAKAAKKADWTPIYERKVLIWPDADNPGVNAAAEIAYLLAPHCPEIKIISVDMANGWDAWDALNEGWTTKRVIEWAKPRAILWNLNMTNNVNIEENTVNISQTTVNVSNEAQAPEDATKPQNESMYATWERLGLALTSGGAPICNEDNVARIFEGEEYLAKRCWFDDFHNSIMLDGEKWREIDTINFMIRLQRHYGMSRISDATIWRGIMFIANREHRNEPMDWFNTLVWDGKSRLNDFFHVYFGAKQTPYVAAASKNFWISMVARVFYPGCIMRSMVILKSKQFTGKSTAFSIIGGKWYCEALENIQSNNFLQSLHGNLLIEFGDLSGMDRADINRIKQIISCRTDRFRAPYERLPSNHKRQCVLVGSTNESQFLRDDTGGTRFWPVETSDIKHKLIERDRDQLFAEAIHRLKAGEDWHIMPAEETAMVQESYRQNDEWEGIISEFLARNQLFNEETTVAKIAQECLHISIDKLDKSTQIRIARNLSTIGFEKFNKRVDNSILKFWRRGVVANCEPATF